MSIVRPSSISSSLRSRRSLVGTGLVAVAILAAAAVAQATAEPGIRHAAPAPRPTTAAAGAPGTTAAAPAAAPVAQVADVAPATTVAPPTTVPAPPARPAVLVGNTIDGRVVRIDTTTGRISAVLATTNPTSRGCGRLVGRPSLAPSSSEVYYGIGGDSGCPWEILRVPSAGGPSVLVTATAGYPKVSPDGTQLAMLRRSQLPGTGSSVSYSDDLVVRSIATGAEKVVERNISCPCGDAPLLSWAPDSRHILYQPLSCGCGGTIYMDLTVVDTADGSTRGVSIPAAVTNHTRAWGDASYLPNGNLFLFEEPVFGMTPPNQAPHMLLVNPASAQVVRVIATGYPDRMYQNTDSDSSGLHLLYLSNTNLMVSDFGARPVHLATGLAGADW